MSLIFGENLHHSWKRFEHNSVDLVVKWAIVYGKITSAQEKLAQGGNGSSPLRL